MPRRLGTVAVCAVLCCFLLAAPASSEGGVDWDFESADFEDWTPSNASLAGDPRAAAGQQALLLRPANLLSPATITSKYWLAPAEPGYRYRVSAALRASAGWGSLEVRLDLQDGSGTPLAPAVTLIPTGLAPPEGYTTFTTETLAPPGTVYLSVSVGGTALSSDADLLIDHVVVTATLEVTPAATATPAPTALATPSPSPSPTATARPTPTSTPSPTPTPPRTPTPRATPAVFTGLTNGDFEDPDDPLYGWSAVGGAAASAAWPAGGRGESAQLASSSSGTKWLQQAVAVVGSSWYEASASLGLDPGNEGWLRLAWYESPDASGTQLSTADSPVASAAVERVMVGPVQAPPGARSARVRLMLRPASGAATRLLVDDVTLRSTAAPTPTPTPTATASPAPSASPSALATPPRAAPPEAAGPPSPASGRIVAGASPALSGPLAPADRASAASEQPPGPLLRISEVLPDPIEPGQDGDYEWLELINLDRAAVSLEGLVLRDNAGQTALPNVTLEAGALLVIGGPRVTLEGGVPLHRLERSLSNGLANGGDRVALVAPGGAVLDALSYGSDRTYEGAPDAPGAGRSIARQFADDGSLLRVWVSDVPSPGRPNPLPSAPAAPEAAVSIERAPAVPEWVLLLGFAAVVGGLAAARRAAALLGRESRGASSTERRPTG